MNNNNASGNKYDRPKIVKNHFEPIDLKAIYNKVKQKEKIMYQCDNCNSYVEGNSPTLDNKEIKSITCACGHKMRRIEK